MKNYKMMRLLRQSPRRLSRNDILQTVIANRFIVKQSQDRIATGGVYPDKVGTHAMTICIILTFNFLLFTCLYAGSSTTYTTANQFNAGTHNNTITFGTGDGDGYVNLTNNFYDTTNASKPPARRWSAMAYSSQQNKIILFGGENAGNPLSDTWIYDPQSEQWAQKSPSTIPNARYGHILANTGSNKAVLFGGYGDSGYLNDTWEYDFDTDNWTQITTISSPTVLAFSCADYDSDDNKIILFGGRSKEGVIQSSATWIYHIGGSSWTKGGWGPLSRKSCGGCYDSENKRFLIFGGEGDDSNFLSDTWEYNYTENSWTSRNPSSKPSPARSEAAMFYDSRNKRSVVFGGSSPELLNDIWFYSYSANKWSTSAPATTPSARYGFTMNYISSIQKAFLFGGSDNAGVQNDFYNYVFRSSGIYTTIHYDTPFSTELYYKTMEVPIKSGIPTNTTLEFQAASSNDNSTYSDFIGYDGTTGTRYKYADTPRNFQTTLHDNKRYLKLKFFFDTAEPPLSGKLDSATVSFNRSPGRPSLSSPTNNSSTNNTTPTFNWYAVSDNDGDSVSYKIEIDIDADLPRVITSSNIMTTSYSTTTVLSHGSYVWWVFAYDGADYSLCSSTYTIYIDTFPPAAVTSFSTSIGSYNGAINLLWTAPENTGSTGGILSGKYYIRYATYAILTQTDWQNNSSGEKTISKSIITPGENQTFTFDGLLDATTYYFSVKTQDGTGNISVISATSPFCMTNAAPVVTVKSPNGSETFSSTKITSWTYSDPYPPGDTHTFSIYDSSDGVNYNSLIVSNLPNGTTYYLWNTKSVRNSSFHKIKVIASDARGLSGYDVSDDYFTVNNPNVAPVVSLIAPNGNEKITGSYTISFSVSDENLADTHKFTILASTNSGYSFDIKIAENITATNYLWNTTQYPNSPKYRVKVIATDDGSPNYSDDDSSNTDFEVKNNNKTPSKPVLLSPLNNSYNTISFLKFVWEKSIDPNPEDFLTYTLYYSTNSYFIVANVVSGITGTEYTPPNLIENIKYYWKVAAVDPFGSYSISDPFNFIASWSKDDSDDGKVRVEITGEFPAGYYVKVENTDADFSIAIRNSISDRLIKYLNQPVYKITVYDKNNSPQNISIKGNVRFNYSDGNADGYVDGTDIKIDNLRIANLNEIKNRWEFPRASQIIDKSKKYVTVDVEQFSYFTIVASVVPAKKVSNIVNFPNPFNPDKEITTIKYVLTKSDNVLIRIFNLVGDLVYEREIDAGQEGAIGRPEGYSNEITWDGKNGNGVIAANGVYILEIKAGIAKDIRKIAVIK